MHCALCTGITECIMVATNNQSNGSFGPHSNSCMNVLLLRLMMKHSTLPSQERKASVSRSGFLISVQLAPKGEATPKPQLGSILLSPRSLSLSMSFCASATALGLLIHRKTSLLNDRAAPISIPFILRIGTLWTTDSLCYIYSEGYRWWSLDL